MEESMSEQEETKHEVREAVPPYVAGGDDLVYIDSQGRRHTGDDAKYMRALEKSLEEHDELYKRLAK
jgi:hypothetical protein